MGIYDGVEINPFTAPTAADYVDWQIKGDAMKLQYDQPESVNYAGTEKKANHRAPIVRIAALHPIEGADRIESPVVDGFESFSFVSQKGTFMVGDLAVFIQPDSIVPQIPQFAYLWADYASKMYPLETAAQVIPASHRRITVRRFKKVWSEGLLVPIHEFPQLFNPGGLITVGDDVSTLLGIEHYDADAAVAGSSEAVSNEFVPRGRRRRPSTLKGWFFYLLHKLHVIRHEKFLHGPQLNIPVYDVENFKNYPRTFVDGEMVQVTEKIHGSSARFVAVDGVLYAGSRKQWVNTKGDSYPALALRANPWIETWCRYIQGYVLYGEVTPRQKGFDYASKSDNPRFWLFDIRSPQGQWLDADDMLYFSIPRVADTVPILYTGGYDNAFVDILVDAPTAVRGASHIREGIVIKTVKTDHRRGVGRAQLKIVSNAFLDKDGKLNKE